MIMIRFGWLIQLIIIWPQRVDADASIRILSIHTPSSSINLIAFAIHISSRHHDHRPILISNQHHSICFGFLSFQFAFHFDHLHMFFEENCCNHTFSSIAASIQPNTRKKHLGLHTPLGHFTSSHSGSVVKVKHRKNCECCPVSSVTINCQVTKIVMNSGSQLSEL